MFRKLPEFNFPLPRFQQQYDQFCKLSRVAKQMENFGVLVDQQQCLTHKREAEGRAEIFLQLFLEQTGLKAEDLGKKRIGANAKKVSNWFKDQGAPDVVFDKDSKKPQFNAAALTCWASDFPNQPFSAPAAALLGLRKAKVASRFANSYHDVALHSADGRIHFGFNVIGTKGERWSASAKFRWREADGSVTSYSLNAQNVPNKETFRTFPGFGELALQVSLRNCFIPYPGTIWTKWDYEGAEATLIAYYTRDRKLLEWIDKGLDIHTENAKIFFPELKIPQNHGKIGKSDPILWQNARVAAKPAMYGLTYQMPVKTKKVKPPHEVYAELYKQWKQAFPNLDEVYFSQCVGRFWEAHPDIRAWQEEICRTVERDGYVVLPQTGKTLYVASTAKGKNMSGNFFMQSGLGACISLAIPPVAARMDWKPNGLALLLQVHDELDAQIPLDRVDEICEFVSQQMSAPADFGGYIGGVSAAPDIGPNWGRVKAWKKG